MGFGGFDGMGGFGAFELIFGVMFVLVIGMFIAVAVRGLGAWRKNNHSPRLTVDAVVTSKRMDVHSHMRAGEGMHAAHSSTWYYVTFEVESGDRMELSVDGAEYGMLAEGDQGKLSFQGTRYLGFERN